MNTHTFIKEKKGWYLNLESDLEEFNHTDMALMEGSNYLLDLISNGQPKVTVSLDTEPFEKAVELKLIEICDTPSGGGYYEVRNDQGKLLRDKVWVCDVPLFVFGDIPDSIYIRKVPSF
jgi:hypothetical protein